MNNFNNAHLSDFYRTKYLGPLTSAMSAQGYDVHVLCLPKESSTSSDLPILTDGNVTIARAKVIFHPKFVSYTYTSFQRMLSPDLVTMIQVLGK